MGQPKKRVITVPTARVAVVKFIIRPPWVHNYIDIMYHYDTKVCNDDYKYKENIRKSIKKGGWSPPILTIFIGNPSDDDGLAPPYLVQLSVAHPQK